MCANQLEMMKNVVSLIKLDVDMLHFDIMDGQFVSNLALNLDILRQSRPLTRIPFDVHLMVEKPSTYFDEIIEGGADIIEFHVETLENIEENINYLKKRGVQVGLSLHLDTPLSAVEPYLHNIDYVLLMNVKTGYSGLSFDNKVLEKSRSLYAHIQKNKYNVKIISDGGIKLSHIEPLHNAGVDVVVAGTSMLFNKKGFSANLETFRKLTSQLGPRSEPSPIEAEREMTYNAAVLEEVNKFQVQQKKIRSLQPGEALVRVMSCGVCGSDLVRVYHKGMYEKNLVPGHEFSGIVVQTHDAQSPLINKRVAVYPVIPCKKCEYCAKKDFNLCVNYNYLGSRTDGGFAQYVITPEENLLLLPQSVSFDEAAMIEPLAVAFHAVSKLQNHIHQRVLILGLGPIGLLCGMMCLRLGARQVTGVDRNQHKKEKASEIGFQATYTSLDQVAENSHTTIIDCSGDSSFLDEAIPLMKKQGTVLIVANHERDFVLKPRTMSTIIRGETTVITSWNSLHEESLLSEWKTCVELLAKKEVDILPLVTHSAPLSNIVQIFNQIKQKEILPIKAIINPN